MMNGYEINKTVVLLRVSLDDAIGSLNNTSARHVRSSVLTHLAKSKGYLFTLKNLLKKEQDNKRKILS